MTGYVNSFDKPVAFSCRPNYYVSGVRSYHDNDKEDRRFDFQCCSISGKCTRNCYLAGPVNDFDGNMDHYLHGKVITGAFSWHRSDKE